MNGFASLLGPLLLTILLSGCSSITIAQRPADGSDLVPVKSPETFLYGYIDRSGKLVIPMRFSAADYFSEGLAKVTVDGRSVYINPVGGTALELKRGSVFGRFREGLAVFSVEEKDGPRFGCIDRTGKIVIEPVWRHLGEFHEGLATIWLKDKFGYLDRSGTVVIAPQFDHAESFSEGFAAVSVKVPGHEYRHRPFFIDRLGKKIIDNGRDLFTAIASFHEGHAAVLSLVTTEIGPMYRWGYIDPTGTIVIPQRYGGYNFRVGEFREGLAAVSVHKQWGDGLGSRCGFIDRSGMFVIPPQFAAVYDFSEGLAVALTGKPGEKRRFGYIDRQGGYAFEQRFDEAESFRNGVAKVTLDGMTLYLSQEGKVIWPRLKER